MARHGQFPQGRKTIVQMILLAIGRRGGMNARQQNVVMRGTCRRRGGRKGTRNFGRCTDTHTQQQQQQQQQEQQESGMRKGHVESHTLAKLVLQGSLDVQFFISMDMDSILRAMSEVDRGTLSRSDALESSSCRRFFLDTLLDL